MSLHAPDACAQLVPWIDPSVSRVHQFGGKYAQLLRIRKSICRTLTKYPDLTPRVDSLLLRYDTFFSTAYARYEAYIVRAIGQDQFSREVQNIRDETPDPWVSDTTSRQFYTRYLNLLDSTLRPLPSAWILDPMRVLFYFRYQDAPEREISDGYRCQAHWKGSLDGNSLLYTMSIPRSWAFKDLEEGDEGAYISAGGIGLQAIQYSYQAIPRRRADKGVDWYLQPKHQKIISKQEGAALVAETFSGGFCPAGVLEPQEISETVLKVHRRCYFFIDQGYIHTLYFSLSIDEWGKPIEVEKHRALMDMIARSFRVRKM